LAIQLVVTNEFSVVRRKPRTLQAQIPNEGSAVLDFLVEGDYAGLTGVEVIDDRSDPSSDANNGLPHVQSYSLDELFPDIRFSPTFATSTAFRTELRFAIRADVFDVYYQHIKNEKARSMLLLPDSSLQGGWNNLPLMTRTTTVLQTYLGTGPNVPTGNVHMETIGRLCYGGRDDALNDGSLFSTSSSSSSHWMDIVGIANRKIPYSWHQDRNDGNGSHRTVLWGFPKDNEYHGTGVFSHVVKLRYPVRAAATATVDDSSRTTTAPPPPLPPQQPIVYNALTSTTLDEQRYIYRPVYGTGAEILVYRDANILHSAPDVTYRTSLMRFMVSSF
jgi:hypothetical protein